MLINSRATASSSTYNNFGFTFDFIFSLDFFISAISFPSVRISAFDSGHWQTNNKTCTLVFFAYKRNGTVK